MKQIVFFGMCLLLTFGFGMANAQTPFYEQDFETNAFGWEVFSAPFNAVRVSSGTNGITSASGSYHAEIARAATHWGGYSCTPNCSGTCPGTFPEFGYITSVDVYLDLTATSVNDTRIDFTSAINTPSGVHRRDFAFNGGFYNDSDVTGSGPRFVFSASNNTGRSNSYPKNPARDPYSITSSGWYTFEHKFYDDGNGVLAVNLSIIDAGGNVLHTWTLSDPTDLINVTVGGNRYGWFATNEFNFLAIDNAKLIKLQDDSFPHNFVLFATERVSGSKFALVEGDIHSNEEVELKSGKNGVVNGNITAVEEISIDKKNIVNGDVTAPEVDNDGTVNGTITEGPVDPVVFPDIPPFTAGTQDVEVDKGDTYTLMPGAYRDIDVGKNATLNLSAGDYYADELQLNDNSQMVVDVSGGAVNVYLEGELDHRKNAEVVVVGGSTELFTLYTLANKYVKIRGTFRGNLIAPNVKDVRLEKNAYFMGAMCASQISLKTGSVAVPHGSSTLPKVLAGDGDDDPASVVPTDYALEQNYPNPFNPTTTIRFNLPEAASVTLKVFNVHGQLVKTLYSGELSAGSHQLQWDATNELGQKVTSGVYFYQLQSRDFRQVRKMMLMK